MLGIYSDEKIVDLAVTVLKTALSWQDEEQMNLAAEAYRQQLLNQIRKNDQAFVAKARQTHQNMVAASLIYPHVAFNPFYKGGKYWPDSVRIHERKPGQHQTLCGIFFEPSSSNTVSDLIEADGEFSPDFIKCGVCEAYGGIQIKQEKILWVSRIKRPPVIATASARQEIGASL